MRYLIQRRTWAAATCWQLLIALQLPRYDWCRMGHRTLKDLENMSEVQVDEKIIPAIADLDIPLVLGCKVENTRGSRELVRGTGRRQIIPAITDLDIPLGMGS